MNPNDLGRDVRSKLTKLTDEVDKLILEASEAIRETAVKTGRNEEENRIIKQIESFPQWNIMGKPGTSPGENMTVKRGEYERLCAYERVFKIALNTPNLSFSDFKQICQGRGILEEHQLLMFSAVKFDIHRLMGLIDMHPNLA